MNRPCLALAFFVLAALPCRAQTGYPMVSRIEPVAIQRGKAVELSFGNSGNGSGAFTGAFALLCEGPGLKGEVLSVETPTPTPAKTKGRGMRRRKACPPSGSWSS
jgi:hypothetical protein